MTVVNLPNDTIRLFCDLCPTAFQDIKGSISSSADDTEGWMTILHDRYHHSNICPECVAKIKED